MIAGHSGYSGMGMAFGHPFCILYYKVVVRCDFLCGNKMFMLMVITISKKEIFDEVEKRSSLEGSVLPERMEGVWASADEGVFLDSFWVEGYTAIVQLMKRYLKSSTVSYKLDQYDKDEVLTIEAEMPARYNSLLDGSVSTDVKMLIACNVLHGWLEVKMPEAAAKYDEEAKGYAEDLRVKLLYRDAPDDDFSSARTDDDLMDKAEAELSSARTDDVKMDSGADNSGVLSRKDYADAVVINPEWEYIDDAKVDAKPLRQEWNKCEEFDDCLTRIWRK